MKKLIPLVLILSIPGYESCSPATRFSSSPPIYSNTRTVAQDGDEIVGEASYYAEKFHGRKTANGEIFDMYKKSAAHKTLPFNTIIEVTNLDNKQRVTVRINDRGPFIKGRILDLSYAAAREIDMISSGVAQVSIKIIKTGDQ